MTVSYFRNIYLGDTDAAGVLYFAQGMSICHEAYEEWLKMKGLSLQNILKENKIALPIVHSEIDFFKPIVCGDKLEIRLELVKLDENSFAIAYTIIKLTIPDKILAKASTVHVCINPQTRQRAILPDAILNSCPK